MQGDSAEKVSCPAPPFAGRGVGSLAAGSRFQTPPTLLPTPSALPHPLGAWDGRGKRPFEALEAGCLGQKLPSPDSRAWSRRVAMDPRAPSFVPQEQRASAGCWAQLELARLGPPEGSLLPWPAGPPAWTSRGVRSPKPSCPGGPLHLLFPWKRQESSPSHPWADVTEGLPACLPRPELLLAFPSAAV